MAVLPEFITDFNDPRVDVFRNVRDADLRGRDELFMAESELVLRRLLRTPERLHSILLSEEKYSKLKVELPCLPPQVPVLVANLRLIHEIAAFHVHRGVLAAGKRLPDSQLTLDAALGHLKNPGKNTTFILCEGITNVDNMGAIFRNAAAFGVDGIVLDPTCCDPLYRKAIRVSMGHALSIPYAVCRDWPQVLRRLKAEWGMAIIGVEHTGDATTLWQMIKCDRTALVFGSEGHGVDRATLDTCDQVVAIPMSGNVPSINVSVASAVALYELGRARLMS